MMTPRLSDRRERISLEDIWEAQEALDLYIKETGRWTYDFNITSDSVPQREETSRA